MLKPIERVELRVTKILIALEELGAVKVTITEAQANKIDQAILMALANALENLQEDETGGFKL
jgi:hypothetical protein